MGKAASEKYNTHSPGVFLRLEPAKSKDRSSLWSWGLLSSCPTSPRHRLRDLLVSCRPCQFFLHNINQPDRGNVTAAVNQGTVPGQPVCGPHHDHNKQTEDQRFQDGERTVIKLNKPHRRDQSSDPQSQTEQGSPFQSCLDRNPTDKHSRHRKQAENPP